MICGLITSNFGMGNKLEEIKCIKEKVDILKNITDEKRIFLVCKEEDKLLLENSVGILDENVIRIKGEVNNNIMLTISVLHISIKYNNPNILLMNSNTYMRDVDKFSSLTIKYEKALDIIRNGLVTFGMKIEEKLNSNCNYIRACSQLKNYNTSSFYKVEALVKASDNNKGQGLEEDGNYLWDSGIYLFKSDFIIRRIKQFIPNTYTCINQGLDINLNNLETEEFIYNIKELYVVPTDIGWYKASA